LSGLVMMVQLVSKGRDVRQRSVFVCRVGRMLECGSLVCDVVGYHALYVVTQGVYTRFRPQEKCLCGFESVAQSFKLGEQLSLVNGHDDVM